MSRSFTTLAALFAALILALSLSPAALGQVADDQYADPFGDLPDEPSNPAAEDPDPPSDQGSSPASGGGDQGPSSAVPDATADTADTASGDTSDGSDTAGTDEELARTGLPADVLLLLGISLLCAGVSMRLFLRPAHWREAP